MGQITKHYFLRFLVSLDSVSSYILFFCQFHYLSSPVCLDRVFLASFSRFVVSFPMCYGITKQALMPSGLCWALMKRLLSVTLFSKTTRMYTGNMYFFSRHCVSPSSLSGGFHHTGFAPLRRSRDCRFASRFRLERKGRRRRRTEDGDRLLKN